MPSSPLEQFVALVTARFREDHCIQLASSLTFTTLLSLVPLLTIMLTLFTAFPGFSQFTIQVDEFATQHMLPQEIGSAIRDYLEQFSSNAGRLTALGTTFLAVVSFLLMLTIERAFNGIWRVRRGRPVAQRIMMYWAILTLGPVLIGASVSMTTYLVTLSLGGAEELPALRQAVFSLMPLVLTIAAFTLLYLVVPSRPVRLLHALLGGTVAGMLFELMKRGFALYVSNIPAYAIVYGAFVIIPIFLLWVYLSWVVALLGAVVTAALPDWGLRGAARPMVPGSAFADALAVLRELMAAQQEPRTVEAGEISERTGIPYDKCERVLNELHAAGWSAPSGDRRWVLACDADLLKVSEVFRRFVFRSDELAVRLAEEGAPGIAERTARLEDALDVPLRSFVGKPLATSIRS